MSEEKLGNEQYLLYETTQLEGQILNLASKEWGITSDTEAKAIIATSLDTCAFIGVHDTIEGAENTRYQAGAVHYYSERDSKGALPTVIRKMNNVCTEQEKPRRRIGIVWGRLDDEENKEAIRRELESLGITDYTEQEGSDVTLVLETGEISTEIPDWVREEIDRYYKNQLNNY